MCPLDEKWTVWSSFSPETPQIHGGDRTELTLTVCLAGPLLPKWPNLIVRNQVFIIAEHLQFDILLNWFLKSFADYKLIREAITLSQLVINPMRIILVLTPRQRQRFHRWGGNLGWAGELFICVEISGKLWSHWHWKSSWILEIIWLT